MRYYYFGCNLRLVDMVREGNTKDILRDSKLLAFSSKWNLKK